METGSVENIIKEMIREAAESLAKGAADRSEVVRRLLAKYKLPKFMTKFAGIVAGSHVQRLIEHVALPAGVKKKLVASIVNEVVQGLSSGVAEAAAQATEAGTPPQEQKSVTDESPKQEQKPVTAKSPKGEMLCVVCDVPGVHEYVDGHILCPAVRAAKREWEKENPPKQDQKKSQEKGKDGKAKTHTESVERPGAPYQMEIVTYVLAKRMTVDPFCPVCQISVKHEEALAEAEEKKPYKPMDHAKWSKEIGHNGRWLMIVLAGSTGLAQSDFINEAAKVPPELWKDLAYFIALRIVNRARKNNGMAIMQTGEPIPPDFFQRQDVTVLDPEDIEYCIRFLSGFGVTELEFSTKAQIMLDRFTSNVPVGTLKNGAKIALIACAVMSLVGFAAFIWFLAIISP